MNEYLGINPIMFYKNGGAHVYGIGKSPEGKRFFVKMWVSNELLQDEEIFTTILRHEVEQFDTTDIGKNAQAGA